MDGNGNGATNHKHSSLAVHQCNKFKGLGFKNNPKNRVLADSVHMVDLMIVMILFGIECVLCQSGN